MLEIKNLNKYFNKGKKNEIHVINNTSLSLEEKGLVALLGTSGSGKTTLLNTIGGLDSVKGNIYIDKVKLTSKFTNKVDKIRNLNIGYIFQDYKLIENLSVFDNVAIVLTMIGLKDKQEINKRVEYVLDKVGMLRYKKRPASMLSGGERQRVGIARAIVKNPKILLCDEPTGNLDSKNSLEVMKIIKAISKERLVILVTHETSLARFYATRIVEIKDGKIEKDYINEHDDELDYEIDNSFYLKDFDIKKQLDNDITIYSNEDSKLDLNIVVKGNNIYIKSSNKVEVVDDNSSIEFIDDHYKKIAKKDIDKYDFDFIDRINDNFKKKYSSIFNPFKLIINSFKKIFDFPILKKILLIGFFLSGMFIMYSVSTIGSALKVEEKDFVATNRDYLRVNQNKVSIEDYLNYEKIEGINFIIPGTSAISFSVKYDDYYQTSMSEDSLGGSLSDISTITNDDLIYGRMPENNYEVVVDKLAIDRMFVSNVAQMAGVISAEDMLNRKITIGNMNPFVIVGITDKVEPNIYTSKDMFINILGNSFETTLFDYNLYIDKITLKEGTLPINDYEVIVNINNKETMPKNKTIKAGKFDLKVVGYYTSSYDYNYYLVNNNTVKYNTILNKKGVTILPNDKDNVITSLREKNLNVSDSYEQDRKKYVKDRNESLRGTLIFSGIMLVISLIEIFLMIRSSFLSRIKEIGILRAIGVKKSDIYKMFASEIFAITTIASIPGLVFMAYILKTLSSIKYLGSMFMINLNLIIISIVCIYAFNLVIGLIPVFTTMIKKPAQILSRTDLD